MDPLMLVLIVLVALLLGAVLLLLALQFVQLRASRRDVETAVISEARLSLICCDQSAFGSLVWSSRADQTVGTDEPGFLPSPRLAGCRH